MSQIETPVATVGGRLAAVDALRGIVMVLMVLDHTRDFFMDMRVDATNPATSTLPLFFTRWATHFCAPLFVFLAGASAYLMRALGKTRSRGEQARFLASRGLFLMFLELTLVRLGFTSTWSLDGMFLQVIWAIGLSMVLLATLAACGLPSRWVGALGAVIVLGHNVLDLAAGAGPPGMGSPPAGIPWWLVLLRPGPVPLAEGITWFSAYPVLPWFGIMALGYAFGEVLVRDRIARVRLTAALGLAVTLAFVVPPGPGRVWRSRAVPDPGDGGQERDGVSQLPEIPAFLTLRPHDPGPGLAGPGRARRLRGGDRDARPPRRCGATGPGDAWVACRCSITCSSGR